MSTPPIDLWTVLNSRFSDARREKMNQVAASRTKQIVLVLQDIIDPHNVNACLRTAEGFGVQDIYIVNQQNKKLKSSTVSKGATGWLTIKSEFKSIESCADELKNKGYEIALSMLADHTVPLEKLSIEKPLALVFGNEHSGVSKEWDAFTHLKFMIPMVGMTQSFNISVAAAITMHFLRYKLEDRFLLTDHEQTLLKNQWVCEQVETWRGEYDRLKISNSL